MLIGHLADIFLRGARGLAGFCRAVSWHARLATQKRYRSRLVILWMTAIGFMPLPSASDSPAISLLVSTDEPIAPIPHPTPENVAKVALGERLFRDPRLSGDGKSSCESCHDLDSNGATGQAIDSSPNGGGRSQYAHRVQRGP